MLLSLLLPALAGAVVVLIVGKWVACAVPILLVALCGAHVGYLFLISVKKVKHDKDWFEMKLEPELKAKLQEFVVDIAEQWDIPRPDDIRLSADSAAHVYETKKGKRILVIGGMALAALSRDALGAVVAHELTHFEGGDTTFPWQNLTGFNMMRRLAWEFRTAYYHFADPAVWPIALYHFFVESRYAKDSRDREFRCDARAERHAGKKPTAAALVYIHVVNEMPWAKLIDIVSLAATVGDISGEVFSEQAIRAQQTHPDDWADVTDEALRKGTRVFDDHPCLRERLDAIGATAEQGLAYLFHGDSPPARTLIKDWRTVERKLSVTLTSAYQWWREQRYVGGLDIKD